MSAEAVPGALEAPALAGDSRPTVLVVGTNRRLQRALHECLTPSFACLSARNIHLGGGKPLPALAPDLILVDATHGDMDPARTLARLRETGSTRSAAMLVLDSPAMPAACARWLEAGADDVVRMPFFAPELVARVRNLLAARALAAELAQARHTADLALRVKHDFLCVMSHELKTPLATIQLQLNAIKRDIDPAASHELLAGIDRIWRSSRRMHYLTETMLAWARLDDGSSDLTSERFDLSAVAASVAAEFAPQAAQKDLSIDVRCPRGGVPARGAERLVHLVIHDMLSRAVQVTARGRVEIAVGGHGSAAWVTVRDGAEVLSAEEQRAIFDPFKSTDLVHRRGGAGSGLELHAVREIARAFHGELALRPTDGLGNTFVLTLPSVPSVEQRDRPEPQPIPQSGGGQPAQSAQE